MQIQLTLHGILRDALPRKNKGRTTLDLPANTTVAEVVQQLGIRQNVSAVVNGTEVELSHVLHPGDHLQMFRLIAGGT